MERQYIVRELENVAGRLRKEADVIDHISAELEKGSRGDRELAGIVRDKSGSLFGLVAQIEAIEKLMVIQR